MSDLISVLVPSYNHQAYIAECIQSIVSQTYDNIELLVMDDGSTDDSWDILMDLKPHLQKRFSRTVIKRKENEGIVASLTKLRGMAQGKFIYLIASDDVAKPNAINVLHNFLKENDEYCLAVGDNERVDTKTEKMYYMHDGQLTSCEHHAAFHSFGQFLRHQYADIDFLGEEFGSYRSLLKENYIPNGYLVRGSIYRNVNVYNAEAPLDDWYMMLQLSKHGKFKYIDTVLFSYRWHATNVSVNKQKMYTYTLRTKLAEISNTRNSADGGAINILELHLTDSAPRKNIFTMGKYMKIYRKKGWSHKTLVVEIFGRPFLHYKIGSKDMSSSKADISSMK